ncbi:MAG: ComF family protein, partial [Bacteroidales bacterium]|nr:ComF family protein [Bacteroidales bacterium]
MKKLLSLLNYLLSFFYPRLCVGCQKALLKDEILICLHCLTHLPETRYHLYEDNPLKKIFRGRVKTERVASLLFYKKGNQVQHIIHHLKYKGDKEIGTLLGSYYGRELILLLDFQSIDIILPIPLHKKKERKRGYNQSEWIAKGLSEGMH